jgi:hypothetical protein
MGEKTKAADAREGRPRAGARVPDGDFALREYAVFSPGI